jgi:hypothetical protein
VSDEDAPIEVVPHERLAALGRAAHEGTRFASPEREKLEQSIRKALGSLAQGSARAAALKEIEPLLSGRREAAPAGGGIAPTLSGSAGRDLLGAKASLENQLAGERERLQAAQQALKKEQEDHRQAVESNRLLREQLKQVRDQHDALLARSEKQDADVRREQNERQQVEVELHSLRAKRGETAETGLAQTGRINELEMQILRLHDELDRAHRERDTFANQARSHAATAASGSADTVFAELWSQMRSGPNALPEVFAETHVPNRKTFERLCEVFTYLIHIFLSIEENTKAQLGATRNAADAGDRTNDLFRQLEKTKSISVRLCEQLAGVPGADAPFRQRVKVVYCAILSLAKGLQNVIARSSEVARGKLSVSGWGIGPNPNERAVGEHYRKEVQRTAPDEILSELKKSMGKEVYDRYEVMVRQ